MQEKLTPNWLKEMRMRAGLSQWAVARALGRTQPWLSTIEMGYVSPSEKQMTNIVAAIKTLEKKGNNRNKVYQPQSQ